MGYTPGIALTVFSVPQFQEDVAMAVTLIKNGTVVSPTGSTLQEAREADLLLVIGSSLVVQPAAALPVAAAEAGANVVIVNREPTPLDGLAAVVIHGAVEDVVPALTSI